MKQLPIVILFGLILFYGCSEKTNFDGNFVILDLYEKQGDEWKMLIDTDSSSIMRPGTLSIDAEDDYMFISLGTEPLRQFYFEREVKGDTIFIEELRNKKPIAEYVCTIEIDDYNGAEIVVVRMDGDGLYLTAFKYLEGN